VIRGRVVDAGGGHVDVLVNRDTMHYPKLGEQVVIGNEDVTIAWQVAAKVCMLLARKAWPDATEDVVEARAASLLEEFVAIEAGQ
jgi:hypothetical protein